MELLHWIDPSKLRENLNRNINAIEYLEQHPELVNINILVQNPNFNLLPEHIVNPNLRLDILMNPGPQINKLIPQLNLTEFNIYYFCKNPYCMHLVNTYPMDKNIIKLLCSNINAVDILEQHIDFIDWDYLCLNESPKAIELIMRYPEKINWLSLSSNSSAIKLLEDNLDKIDYWGLSFNHNAIHLIEKYPEKINWIGLSGNKNAIHILEKNRDKIEWHQFSGNPSIFEYNYKKMSIQRTNVLLEELMAKSLHPSRIEYWLMNGVDIDTLP
jgi:hypothetical protein